MGLKNNKLIIGIFILLFNCATAIAFWQGPQAILEGGWGGRPNEFGIEHGDTGDTFPRDIIVLSNNDIWIPDGWVNERLKLYDQNGNLKKIISLDQATRTFPEYWFIGKLAAVGLDGFVYMSDYLGKGMYAQYSPNGQLVKTSTERPLELGRVKSQMLGEKNYKYTITYPDRVYGLTLSIPYRRFIRDNQGRINAVSAKSARKYSVCGKELGVVSIPDDQRRITRPGGGGFEEQSEIIQQYGEPVIAPNGDVYTWKRTPTNYSILKWTWVNDPNMPTGPDAPSGLAAMPSTTGIYLTWTASPGDPGCVTSYEISRATSAGGISSTVGTVNAGVVKYNDTTAAAGTTYYYKVRAVAGSEYSSYTAEVTGKR
ncbi:MAG: NHL repeat-containing protein [Nitrospirota bacterium]